MFQQLLSSLPYLVQYSKFAQPQTTFKSLWCGMCMTLLLSYIGKHRSIPSYISKQHIGTKFRSLGIQL